MWVLPESLATTAGPAALERALGEGPPLGHYEARWARVEVAAATDEESVGRLADEALQRMDAGGVRQGRDRIAALVDRPGEPAG